MTALGRSRGVLDVTLALALGACLLGCDAAPTTYQALVDLLSGGVSCDGLHRACVSLCGDRSACETGCGHEHGRCADGCTDIADGDARYDCEDECDETKSRCLAGCRKDTTACEADCAEARKKC